MSCRGRVNAAIAVAAACVLCCASGGAAQAGDDGARFLLFSGADLWRDGDFVHGGLLWSPDGVDREGFMLQAMASGGQYRYRSGAFNNATVVGTEAEGQVQPGWHFKRDRLEVKVFAGLDIKNDVTRPDDPSNRLHGTSLGARTAVDMWWEPTPSTMLAADASLSSIQWGYSARLAYGWRLNDWFYLGPEAQTFSCIGYQQVRLGIHVTAFRTGAFEWSAAGGWANDSDRRSGAYVRFGVLTRR